MPKPNYHPTHPTPFLRYHSGNAVLVHTVRKVKVPAKDQSRQSKATGSRADADKAVDDANDAVQGGVDQAEDAAQEGLDQLAEGMSRKHLFGRAVSGSKMLLAVLRGIFSSKCEPSQVCHGASCAITICKSLTRLTSKTSYLHTVLFSASGHLHSLLGSGQDVNTCHVGISDAADQAQENADQFERDAQGVVDDIEEVFDDAADQAAEQLSNAADQVQSAAQGAADYAANFANSLQSELAICCHALQQIFLLPETAALQLAGFHSVRQHHHYMSGSDVGLTRGWQLLADPLRAVDVGGPCHAACGCCYVLLGSCITDFMISWCSSQSKW